MAYKANLYQTGAGFSEIEDFTAEVMELDEVGTEEQCMYKIGYWLYDQWFNEGPDTHTAMIYCNHDAEFKYALFIRTACACVEVVACKTYGDYLAFVAAFLPVFEGLNKIGSRTMATFPEPQAYTAPKNSTDITPKPRKPRQIASRK